MKAIYKKIKAIDKYIKSTQSAIEDIKTSTYYTIFSTESQRQKDINKKQIKIHRLVTKKSDCLKMMQIVVERETQKTNDYLMENGEWRMENDCNAPLSILHSQLSIK